MFGRGAGLAGADHLRSALFLSLFLVREIVYGWYGEPKNLLFMEWKSLALQKTHPVGPLTFLDAIEEE